jgi:hypothetical protein
MLRLDLAYFQKPKNVLAVPEPASTNLQQLYLSQAKPHAERMFRRDHETRYTELGA